MHSTQVFDGERQKFMSGAGKKTDQCTDLSKLLTSDESRYAVLTLVRVVVLGSGLREKNRGLFWMIHGKVWKRL